MNKQTLLTAILTLFLGAGGGYWFASRIAGDAVPPYREPPRIGDDSSGKRTILYYRSAMNPSETSTVPAKDAMGMDYIPVYADTDNSDRNEPAGTVRIDPVTVQNIGVRTATAVQSSLSHIIRAVGRVGFDEERLARLHPKTKGWIEALYVDKTGQWVEKDTDLLSFYSPQLVSSQQEYLLALNNLKALENSPIEDIRRGAEELVKSSRERLRLLDVPQHQIRDLEKNREIIKSLHIHTPVAGIVMNVGVREGQYVTPGTELYMIADLSRVWVYANVYEYELPWVNVGDSAEIKLAGIPGTTLSGRLEYVYPYAEPNTRTIKVRLTFDNPDRLLKPDMFAEVTIHAGRTLDAIVIPSEAVVRSGATEQVFVVRAPGKFAPRPVRLGIESSGLVQVLEGVRAGEDVVVSAQFLIDSESKLREATAKMLETSKSAGRPHKSIQRNGPKLPVGNKPTHGEHRHD